MRDTAKVQYILFIIFCGLLFFFLFKLLQLDVALGIFLFFILLSLYTYISLQITGVDFLSKWSFGKPYKPKRGIVGFLKEILPGVIMGLICSFLSIVFRD